MARKAAQAIGRESWFVRRSRPVYESFLDWLSQGQGIPWDINGVHYLIDPHYRHRLGQHYDAPVAMFLRERVQPGTVCMDVGANVGVYVLQFAHWSRPTGRVVAFEPNPMACKILERHVRFNKLTERVRLVRAAVGSKGGHSILYASGTDGMSRMGAPNVALAGRLTPVTVPVVTLDVYCKTEGLIPDWLLIDIEGFEIAALEGARGLIWERGKALGLIVEMHPNVWDSADTTRAKAEALLSELQLRPVPLTGQSDPLGEHGIVHLQHR